jgi:hypothetical protein
MFIRRLVKVILKDLSITDAVSEVQILVDLSSKLLFEIEEDCVFLLALLPTKKAVLGSESSLDPLKCHV